MSAPLNAELELKAPAMLGGGKLFIRLKRDGFRVLITVNAGLLFNHTTEVSVVTLREFAERCGRICNG